MSTPAFLSSLPEGPSIQERFDEMSQVVALPSKVNGLQDYQSFRQLVIDHILLPQNIISLDVADIMSMAREEKAILDASICYTSSPTTFRKAVDETMKALCEAHPELQLAGVCLNIESRSDVTMLTMADLHTLFEENPTVDVMFGIAKAQPTLEWEMIVTLICKFL
ncbi:MAG: hypothetical protein LIO90_03445 [Bacteroidales bacterium]|nr:hypothetical protein [Bacteroidales bacterium]